MNAGSLAHSLREFLDWHKTPVKSHSPAEWAQIREYAETIVGYIKTSSLVLHTPELERAGAFLFNEMIRAAETLDEKTLRGRKRTLAAIQKRIKEFVGRTDRYFDLEPVGVLVRRLVPNEAIHQPFAG